jgi:magnesium transporter
MVLKTLRYVEHDSPNMANEIVETGELMTFLAVDFIITVRHGAHSGLARLRRDLDKDPETLKPGPAAVLHAVTDHVVDHYLEVTSAVEDDIEEMETRVFAVRTMVSAEQTYLMKHEALELCRAVVPLATPVRRLAEGFTRLVPDEVRFYFRDVDDHLTTLSERVAGFDELLTTLVDATLAKITLQQNTDMRKITSWAAIVAVPTMVVGVYGMNFDFMPELHWRYGYFAVLVFIVVVCVLLYRGFKRNGWL